MARRENPFEVPSCVAEKPKNNNSSAEPLEDRFEAVPGIPNSVAAEHYVNFSLAPGEYLIQCPYDKSHRILPGRMGNHMERCRRNYREKLEAQGRSERFINCPWDKFHIISEMEGAYHAAQCPSRNKSKEEMEDFKTYAPKDKVMFPPELAAFTEDWGAEPIRHLSYDPMKKLREQPIFYQPKGLSRAAKMKFREEQRLKFYHLVAGPFWEGFRNSSISQKSEPGSTKDGGTQSPFLKSPGKSPTVSALQPGGTFPTDGPAILVDTPFRCQRVNLSEPNDQQLAHADTRNWVHGQYRRGGQTGLPNIPERRTE